jgi:histidinol-phosphate aminotransferase
LDYVESHTNFILVKVGSQAPAVQQQLVRQGVIVRPCTGYDLPQFLRITVGTPSQNARLIRELESVLEEMTDTAPA